MYRLPILLLLFSSLPAAAAPMTQSERDRALSHLHASRKQVLDAAAALSDAQWKWKPSAERWSVGECVEHLAGSEEMLFGMILKFSQAAPKPGKKSAVSDDDVLAKTRGRSQKFQAPDGLRPQGKLDRPAAMRAYAERRDRTLDFVRGAREDLRSRFAPHPGFGELDLYQWLLLISAHADRHFEQIQEVMVAPGFPKR